MPEVAAKKMPKSHNETTKNAAKVAPRAVSDVLARFLLLLAPLARRARARGGWAHRRPPKGEPEERVRRSL